MTMDQTLVCAKGLVVAYPNRRGWFSSARSPLPVLRGIDLQIDRGETVGIVGESGSGKSTLARALFRLINPSAGSIAFDGRDITGLSEAAMRPLRQRMQMIFQDPMSALNPRHTIGRILVEPILLHGLAARKAEALARVHLVLERVGLAQDTVKRYSHELSGGQRQRVGIARAVVVQPDFILADEIVSGLDVSTQAQVLQILRELTRTMHVALAFISHDLAVVRSVCDRVVVMKDGTIVEEGLCSTLFQAPRHSYTRVLIDAIPLPIWDPGWLDRDIADETTQLSG
jgi:ABC-type microcin C transport system duplicated ATPase subunit YejF